MRAAVYPGGGQPLTIETLPDPEPAPDEVVIRVHRCGICGTDLHMTQGHAIGFPAGCVPGHEYAGEIVAVGRDISTLKSGDLMTSLPSNGCGECEACARGNLVLCHARPGKMGGFGEYLAVPAALSIKLPATLSLADGALIEPLAVGLYGVRMATIRPGARVLILGAGSVALCALYWARQLGAGKIALASRSNRRADMALAMGADAFIAYGETEVAEVSAALGGAPDVVFECVGVAGMLGKAVQHVGKFGQVVSLGFCTSPDAMVPAMAAMKGAVLQFPVGYTLADFEQTARTMDTGHADPKMLISSTVKLDDLPITMNKLREPNSETKVHVLVA